MGKFRLAGHASAGLTLVFSCMSAMAGSFTSLDDAQFGLLSGVSRNGRIVVGSFASEGSYAGSFCWRKGAGTETVNMGSVMNASSWAQPLAGATDDGTGNQVAALAYSDVNSAGAYIIGQFPGAEPQDNFYSEAYGYSDTGVAVGLAQDPSTNAIAFRWTAAEGMSRLAVERPDTYSRANGISGDGHIIYGWNDREDGFRTGIIWIDGSPTALHNPGMYGDSFGSPPGEALASNYNGSVVVGQGYFDDLLQSEAWRWTAAGGTQPIGIILPSERASFASLLAQYKMPAGALANARLDPTHQNPDGFFYQAASYALAVSDDGNTIVGNTSDGITTEAMIWTSSAGMMVLSDYVAARNIAVPPGFFLSSANALSADGLTIAGVGIDPTGTYSVPWVIDLHDAVSDTVVIAQGTIASNDLADGPFAGYPVGTAVSMSFHLAPGGTSFTPARDSAYDVRLGSFQFTASYQDPVDYSQHVATETLDPASAPLLHLSNDNPRADGIDLAATPTATPGQTLELHLSNPQGILFDSDESSRINRSFGSEFFDTPVWAVRESGHSLNIALQFVTIQDDTDGIFGNGFEGN
jgi:uncharacterized membrane protein